MADQRLSDLIPLATLDPNDLFYVVDDSEVDNNLKSKSVKIGVIKAGLNLIAEDVGLENVDNTSDLDKPISTATQAEIDTKADLLVTYESKTANYTLAAADRLTKLIEFNSGSNLTLTVPLEATVSIPVGTQVLVARRGSGTVTIAAEGGVTLLAADGTLTLRVQNSVAALVKISTNAWYVFGDLG